MPHLFLSALIAFCFSLNANAMEEKAPKTLAHFIAQNHKNYRTIKGTLIDGSNLYSVCDKMPEKLQVFVDEWAKENTPFLHEAIPLNKSFDLNKMPPQEERDFFNQFLSRKKFVNQAKDNAVLPVFFEKEMWFVKFACPYRRWFTLKKTTQDWTVPNEAPRTYQTPSSIAYYQLYKNILEAENIKTIELLESYLAPIPGRDPIEEGPHDENCFVVQKKLNTLALLKNNPDYVADLSEQSVKDLLTLMIKGPTWDLKMNLAINIKTNNLVIFDFEQAKNESGAFFFQKNQSDIQEKITLSAIGFLSLIRDGAKTYRSLQVAPTFKTFCSELDKFPMLVKADPNIETIRYEIQGILQENEWLSKKLGADDN
ncbi:hypothetical protein HYX58_05325 [Candidatus Dependentiae bacterium]|nr:hypothetical protein [Candidatus Dependentiae bacterium]